MLRPSRHTALALFSVAIVLHAAPSFAAWNDNVSYGGNMPTDMFVPDGAELPPIVVTLHYCSGNKGNAHQWLESQAGEHGFIIITPNAGGNCFDASPARTGERAEIVKMVEYAVSEYGGDENRVFATGASSGACMTFALLAAYPEVFKAGSTLAGVPAGAWTGGNSYAWSTPSQSDQQWGDKVRQVNPDFTGPWPRVQIWHGQGDTTLTYSQNWPAEVAQWTNVHGVSDGANEMIKPPGAQDTWDRTSYQDDSGTVVVETNSGPGSVPHDLSGRGLWDDVVRFFGLDMAVEPTTTTGAGGTTSTGGGAGGVSNTSDTSGGDDTSTGTTGGGIPNPSTTGTTGASGAIGATATTATTGAGAQTTGGAAMGATTSPPGTSTATSAGTVTSAGPAATTTDGGSTSAPAAAESSEDGGCSCRTAPKGTPGASIWGLLGFGAFGLLCQRRRRRA